jgi:DNA polymerase (family 10)
MGRFQVSHPNETRATTCGSGFERIQGVSIASTLAGTLRTLADLAEIRGEAAETADLRRAAAAIDALSPAGAADLIQRARRDRLKELPGGITPTLYSRLRDLARGGGKIMLASGRASLPALFTQLFTLRVLETEEAARLVRELDILTLCELQVALEDGRVRQLGGDGLDTRLRQAARTLEADRRPIPLGRAHDLLDALTTDIAASAPGIELVTAAGDVRRFESLVFALAIVARAIDPQSAIDAICAMRSVEDVRHRSGRRAMLIVQQAEIDVRVAAPEEYGTFLFHATGSPAHLHAIHRRSGRAGQAAREEDLYADAGLPFIAPELRQGSGEVEAAAAGALPALISREHMLGDLHMHTNYSDGADSLDAMVAACCRLGYEYIAITDHSERACASRTLTRADVSRQRDEIDAIRRRYPGITILHGVEADIMPDGSLDFPDRILESLDIVLASLHDQARHDAKTLTRRCIQAIRHPLVTIVTHPANRLVGRREGYPLDFDAIYAAAAEAGTALEVDGAPSHLDLDGEHARAAIAAGVTLTIDSDCHRARWLERQMHLGIGTARRGWVEPRHVLNARPLQDVRAFIAAKRARR